MQGPRREAGMLKTDKRDVLGLANHLYNQLELGVQVSNKLQVVRRAVPPSAAAAQLKGRMRHRYELVNESTRAKKQAHGHLRRAGSGIHARLQRSELADSIGATSKVSHPSCRGNGKPDGTSGSEKKEFSLGSPIGCVAAACRGIRIGTKDAARQRGLLLEQELLIKELLLIQEHLRRLEGEICQIVEQCRGGKILLSIPPMSPLAAATLLAGIGHIANFADAAHPRAQQVKAAQVEERCGWGALVLALTLCSTGHPAREARYGTYAGRNPLSRPAARSCFYV
jgi:hypothetical protein